MDTVVKLIWVAFAGLCVYGAHRRHRAGDAVGMWCLLFLALGGILGWAGKLPRG